MAGGGTDLNSVIGISSAGMAAQSTRLRVVAENVANQDSTGSAPGADPYRRKTITFANGLDRALGVDTVKVAKVGVDSGAFPLRYDPSHPAADAKGYVKLPNVDALVEALDMKTAQRAYDANLNVIETQRAMAARTLDIIRK